MDFATHASLDSIEVEIRRIPFALVVRRGYDNQPARLQPAQPPLDPLRVATTDFGVVSVLGRFRGVVGGLVKPFRSEPSETLSDGVAHAPTPSAAPFVKKHVAAGINLWNGESTGTQSLRSYTHTINPEQN
jgi:hypothetical protein